MPPHALISAGLECFRAFAGKPGVRLASAIVQYAFLFGVVGYLIYQLADVGWEQIAGALPTSPLFYVIFAVRYLAPPLSEIPAYELVWRRPLWRRYSAFLRKRVYNFAVMGYSGEAFFTLWARRSLDLSDREIFLGVKDNNLISALVSNTATAAIVIALFVTDGIQDGLKAFPGSGTLFALAFLSAFGLAAAVVVFRRKIIGLPKRIMAQLIAINTIRIVFVFGLHALLYSVAIPGPPLSAWFIFIALQLVLSRIPFLPNLDIVFLTAALHLSAAVDVPEAEIAGMLVAEAGLSQLFNLAMFAATTHLAFSAPSGGAFNRRKAQPPASLS